jgi:hypothetical protein
MGVEMKKNVKRMELIVKRFQRYVATYSDQALYGSYSDETFLSDMLYGIGIAFDPKFKFHNGYEKWLEVLQSFLGTKRLELTKKRKGVA